MRAMFKMTAGRLSSSLAVGGARMAAICAAGGAVAGTGAVVACSSSRRFAGATDVGAKAASGQRRWDGQVLVDVCVVPLGVGVSVRKEVTEVERILRRWEKEGKVKCMLHGYGTNVSGHWDDVMGAIREVHETLHDEMGVTRITSSLRMGTRIDKAQTIEDKVNAVEEGLVANKGPGAPRL